MRVEEGHTIEIEVMGGGGLDQVEIEVMGRGGPDQVKIEVNAGGGGAYYRN